MDDFDLTSHTYENLSRRHVEESLEHIAKLIELREVYPEPPLQWKSSGKPSWFIYYEEILVGYMRQIGDAEWELAIYYDPDLIFSRSIENESFSEAKEVFESLFQDYATMETLQHYARRIL